VTECMRAGQSGVKGDCGAFLEDRGQDPADRSLGGTDAQVAPLKLAYLVNQYPQTSHSFIRREIAALEARGLSVERFSIREGREVLVDALDQAERARTRVVLKAGVVRLIGSVLGTLAVKPRAWARTLWLALRVGRRSERGVFIHLIYLAEACLLRRWFLGSGIQHVHAHFGTNSATAAMLCRALGGPPYSLTVHGPEEFDRPRALSLGEKIERAAFAVAISAYGRSQLYRWTPYRDWSKIHIVHCGLDILFLDALATSLPTARRLVNVGRLVPQKGQLILIEAAARLRAEGKDFELTLVGDGPLRGEIEALIRRHHLEERVRLVGWQSNATVRTLILDSRALVLPSFAEGLPVALMEAMALGRPVISTTVAGIPELVRPGENGWLVTPGSVEALVQAMSEALDATAEQIETMGRAGAARVRQDHDASKEAGRLARLFHDNLPTACRDGRTRLSSPQQSVDP
jgi:colanic acid/amylovoran biosynthesis glycosyltransferase